MQVVSIGEILWDVFPGRELLGGAPLNFSANSVRLGNGAALVTAIGNDERGRLARTAMLDLGVDTSLLQVVDDQATGVALVSTGPGGEPHFEIPRPAAFDRIALTPEMLDRVTALRPSWLYFGTLLHIGPGAEEVTRRLAAALPGVRCFYDMNLRPGSWNLALVQRLSGMASILKLNEFEAQVLAELTGTPTATFSLERFCESWADRYGIESICVTLGPAGCMVYQGGATHTVPGFPALVEDTVGAGDAFAAAFLHGHQRGWPVEQTARFANALGSIVASRAGATPPWTVDECRTLAGIGVEPRHAM